MKRYFFNSLQEAKEATEKMLLQGIKEKGIEWTIDSTEAKYTEKKGEENILYTQRDSEGNTFYVKQLGNKVFTYYLSSEEVASTNYTYPLRAIREEELITALMFGAVFHKPQKALTAEEALTSDGMGRICTLFDTKIYETSREKVESFKGKDIFTAFLNEDNSIDLIQVDCTPAPYLLEELTGVKVKKAKDYLKGMEALFKQKFSKDEAQAIEEAFIFHNTELFLNYLLYEFLRTEKYTALQEALKEYPIFGLSKEWEKNIIFESEKIEKAEEYILSIYLCSRLRTLIGDTNLRNIAEYTGTPYPLLLKAAQNDSIQWR